MSDLWYKALDAIGGVMKSDESHLLADIDNSARTAIAVWTLSASKKLSMFASLAHRRAGTARSHVESWRAAVKVFIPEVGGDEWRTETFRLIDRAIDAILKAAEAQHSDGAS